MFLCHMPNEIAQNDMKNKSLVWFYVCNDNSILLHMSEPLSSERLRSFHAVMFVIAQSNSLLLSFVSL